MRDPEKLAAVRIMTLLTTYLYWTGGISGAVISMRIVRLSIKYGISHMSAVGLAFYGSMVCETGCVDHGYMLGQLTLKILDRFDVREWKCRILVVETLGVQVWKDAARGLIPQIETAAQAGFNTGDTEFALSAAGVELITKTEIGDPRVDILAAWRKLHAQLKHLSQKSASALLSIGAQMTANLLGEGEASEPWILTGEFMSEEEAVCNTFFASIRACGHIYFLKSYIAFFMGEFRIAADLLAVAGENTRTEEYLHLRSRLCITWWSQLRRCVVKDAQGTDELKPLYVGLGKWPSTHRACIWTRLPNRG